MGNRLMKFLTEQKILYLEQFGWKNFSTAYAILLIVSKMHLKKNKFECGVLLTSIKHLIQLIMRSPC